MAEPGIWEDSKSVVFVDIDDDDDNNDNKRKAVVTQTEVDQIKSDLSSLRIKVETQIAEMTRLLGAVHEEGPATQEQSKTLQELSAKMQAKKKELEQKKRELSQKELGLMKTQTAETAASLELVDKEVQVKNALESVRQAESVELAFIVDFTRSMKPHIQEVKASVKKMAEAVARTNTNLRLRIAVVGYRDLKDKVQFEIMDFDESIPRLVSFLGSVRAGGVSLREGGGGDFPEDIAGAFRKAHSALSWQSPTRVAILVTDAPCHGRQYHNMKVDDFPDGTPGMDVLEELSALAWKKATNGTMSLYFGRITHHTDKMMRIFKKRETIEVLDFKDADTFAKGVKQAVRRSIFRTVTTTVHVKPFALEEEEEEEDETPDPTSDEMIAINNTEPSDEQWIHIPTSEVVMLCNVPIRTLSQLEQPLRAAWLARSRHTAPESFHNTNGIEKSTCFLKRAAEPFSEGGCRVAFHGRLSTQRDSLSNHKSAVVLKTKKRQGLKPRVMKHYLAQMEVSNIAAFLAKEYNKSMARPKKCKEIEVLQVRVLEESDPANGLVKSRYCAEKALPNGFTRFSSNTGFWDEENIDESLLRFSKYTFEATRGYLMVVDLQGVRTPTSFILTDPAIHCIDLVRFGTTNLGRGAMFKCLESTNAMLAENGWD